MAKLSRLYLSGNMPAHTIRCKTHRNHVQLNVISFQQIMFLPALKSNERINDNGETLLAARSGDSACTPWRVSVRTHKHECRPNVCTLQGAHTRSPILFARCLFARACAEALQPLRLSDPSILRRRRTAARSAATDTVPDTAPLAYISVQLPLRDPSAAP